MAYDNRYRGGGLRPPGPQGGPYRGQPYTQPPRNNAYRPRSPSEALEPMRGPNPPGNRRRGPGRLNPFFRFLKKLFIFCLILVLLAGGLLIYGGHQLSKTGPLNYPTVVDIPKGMGITAIASKLEREGIISNQYVFLAKSLCYEYTWPVECRRFSLKAGEYEIPKGASITDVLEKLVSGKAVLYQVTLPEGLTSQQIVERINAEPNLTGQITQIPPEGSMLPDTYKFVRNTDRNDLVRRLQGEQQRFLELVWPKRSKNTAVKTKEEVVILASIIEKESGSANEKTRISGVFTNRLKKGMRLQSDPTIIYGIAKGQGSLGRSITKADIRQKTEYNTYHIDGLPPTPISNPSRAALEAVLNPANTNDLYFVANGQGGHNFAATLKEHNENVAKWRVIEKEMRKDDDKTEDKDKDTAGSDAKSGDDTKKDEAASSEQNKNDKEVPGVKVNEGEAKKSNASDTKNDKAKKDANGLPVPDKKQ